MSGPVPGLANGAEAFAVGLLALALVPLPAPTAAPVLLLRAHAVDMSGGARDRSQTLEIAIERWTDAETRPLRSTLDEQTARTRHEARGTARPRAGYIRRETGAGWDVQYARLLPLPSGGRRVVFATERPVRVFEPARVTLTREYAYEREYLVGEIRLAADGTGEGQLATAASLRFDADSGEIDIENDDGAHVKLSQVIVENAGAPRPQVRAR